MSYRIEYDRKAGKYEIRDEVDIFPWLFAGFGVVLILTLFFREDGMLTMREHLIPGDDVATIQAFSAMADDLHSGATILQALESFCRTVIHGK
jgi:hypothetical protein